MNVSLLLGRYSLSLQGDERLFEHLPYGWRRFQQERDQTRADAKIRLAEEDFPTAGGFPGDGWTVTGDDGRRLAAYAAGGRYVFAIGANPADEQTTVYVRGNRPESVRMGVQYGMMTALSRECVGLHGVTLLCGNEIVILSAPSGTGKTTLGRLLEKHCGAIVINGDFSLLSPTADGVIFEPTPFCGSSGRSLNHRLRVNRVVFLEQAETNDWRDLTGREALTRFMGNAFIPVWDDAMRRTIQENILQCVSVLRVNAFAFAPTQEAAEIFSGRLQTQKTSKE